METLLLILGATIAGLINGVQAMYYGSLGAALDALLAPFNNERRMRHLSFKVDRYYQRLTRRELKPCYSRYVTLMQPFHTLCRGSSIATSIRPPRGRRSFLGNAQGDAPHI